MMVDNDVSWGQKWIVDDFTQLDRNQGDVRGNYETVHILRAGLPLCRFTFDVPRDWPEGHGWTHEWDKANANCGGCVSELERSPSKEAL